MPTVRFKARYGTWYRSDDPARVFFNFRSYVAVRASGPIMQSVLHFTNPFPPVPGVRVTGAKIRLWLMGGTSNGGTRSVALQRVANGLRFNQITYNNRPTEFIGATSSVQTTGPLSGGHLFEFDVTADLAAVASGSPFYGYIVTTTAPFTMQLYGANSQYPPELEVTYTQPPTMPRDLSPGMGRVAGVTRPHLTWSYYDVNGSERLTAVRVQTNSTSSFTSPAWDSGVVATTEAGLDLATTSFPATAPNAVTWWRAQVRSADGTWSDWSTPTSWVFRTKPTGAITNPAGTFSDPTPPIVWTYSSPSGSPQSKYRVALYEWLFGRWTLRDSSGILVGDATAWTPTRPAHNFTARHRAVVNVWDSYNRESTPGDGGFTVLDSVVDYAPSGTVAAPVLTSATAAYPRPEMNLAWTRAEVPDFWAITRDGVLVERVPGPDLAAPGGYAFTDYAPKGEHLWEIRAVVNGQASAAASATRTVDFLGTWLVDPEVGTVCIQNDTDHNPTMPDEGAVHEPLGSPRAVVITQALRGYQDTLNGLLTDLKGQDETAAQWRANLLAMKSRPENRRTLLVEDMAFPVVTRNIQLRGAPGHRGWFASVEYYQQGGYLFDPMEA